MSDEVIVRKRQSQNQCLQVVWVYYDRWHIELDLRAIKEIMQMDILRCKKPEMVEKEISMHLLGYNLVRWFMVQSAVCYGKSVRQLSFKGALQLIRNFLLASKIVSKKRWGLLYEKMLHAMSQNKVGCRPRRREPRAIKRRPKNYPLLMQPRIIVQGQLL